MISYINLNYSVAFSSSECNHYKFLYTELYSLLQVRRNPDDLNETPKEVLKLMAGQYFGERALLTSAKRAANVVASLEVSLLCISRDAFEAALGGTLQV